MFVDADVFFICIKNRGRELIQFKIKQIKSKNNKFAIKIIILLIYMI
jgi:hypothetical protein